MTPQQIKAMKLALEALEACNIYGELECVMTPDSAIYLHPAITAIKERLADPMRDVQRLGQEIEQCSYPDCKCPTESPCLKGLAQPEQETVAWPCLIDSADFSENTITLVMQCEDYKVSAGTHWLSTTPPKD
jgi:hypothetical protein